ncbi:MAG: P-type conjugative transfer protein TrbL [Synergistaceae bacterium]|jgi:type IV secretion system protein TrbL|nr:P-type conjugative transfer protein TrbL [Synergistaceae bacterium]
MGFSKRWRKLLTALLIAAALCAASPSFAAWSTSDGADAVDSFISEFVSRSDSVRTAFAGAAMRLFWILALIQFVWAGLRLLLSGDFSFFSFARTAVREIMFIGLFYWLLTQAPVLGNWIVANGLRALGAASGYQYINPAGVFSKGVAIVYGATKTAFTLGVSGALWAVVPYALTLVAFAFAAAFAAVYLIEYYIVVPVGVILLGLGGSLWSKKFAENFVRVLISVGFKMTCLQIVLGVSSELLDGLQISVSDVSTVGTEGFFLHMFNLAGLSVLTFVAVKKIPDFAASLVSGAWFESASPLELDSNLGRFSYAGAGNQGPGGSYSDDLLAVQQQQQEPAEFDDRGGRDNYLESALTAGVPGETAWGGGFSGGELSDIASGISVSAVFSEIPDIQVNARLAGPTERSRATGPGGMPGWSETPGLPRKGVTPTESGLPEEPRSPRRDSTPVEPGLPEELDLLRRGVTPTESGLPGEPGPPRRDSTPGGSGLPEELDLLRRGVAPTESGLPEEPRPPRRDATPGGSGLPEELDLLRRGVTPTESGLPEEPRPPRRDSTPGGSGLPEELDLLRRGVTPTESGLPEEPRPPRRDSTLDETGMPGEQGPPRRDALPDETGMPGEQGPPRRDALPDETGLPGEPRPPRRDALRGKTGPRGEPGEPSDHEPTARRGARQVSHTGGTNVESVDISVNLSGDLSGSSSERMRSAIRETLAADISTGAVMSQGNSGAPNAAMQPMQRAVIKDMMDQIQNTGDI